MVELQLVPTIWKLTCQTDYSFPTYPSLKAKTHNSTNKVTGNVINIVDFRRSLIQFLHHILSHQHSCLTGLKPASYLDKKHFMTIYSSSGLILTCLCVSALVPPALNSFGTFVEIIYEIKNLDCEMMMFVITRIWFISKIKPGNNIFV